MVFVNQFSVLAVIVPVLGISNVRNAAFASTSIHHHNSINHVERYIQPLLLDQHHRKLEDNTDTATTIPDGIAICEEYFFGRINTESNVIGHPQPFCVNGGICKSTWVHTMENPCTCVDGYTGPHCEFKSGTEPAVCHLGCQNNGKCHIGAPSWQHYYRNTGGGGWTNPLDLQHCSCPTGYTGLLCEIKGTPCGDNHCHHGGKCVEKTQDDGSMKFYCDCSTATNNDGDVAYAGQYCQHTATSFCNTISNNEDNQNGNHFCVNGGSCQSESYLGCTCQEGYAGPLCEFEDNGQVPETCSLTCQNRGICRKGAKDVSLLDNVDAVNDTLKTSYNDEFEHCVCPKGYIGLQCEFQLDQCPGGAHVCLNGGQCITAPNGTEVQYACDCSNARTDTVRYAGLHCDVPSTEFCTTDQKISQFGDSINAFCTNHGKCRDYVEHGQKHPGCSCPKGFGGENCQFKEDNENKHTSKMAGILGGLLVTASIVGVFVLLRNQRRRTQQKNHLYSAHTLPPTLDIIRSLGHDREAEYTDVVTMVATDHNNRSSSVTATGTNRYSNYTLDENVVIRKSYWPGANNVLPSTAIQSYSDVSSNAIQVYDHPHRDSAVRNMNQSAVVDDEIRFSRKTYWPNDVHNDASNPIHIFDDISIKSDIEDSINITIDDDDDDEYDEEELDGSSYGMSDDGKQFKTRGRIL